MLSALAVFFARLIANVSAIVTIVAVGGLNSPWGTVLRVVVVLVALFAIIHDGWSTARPLLRRFGHNSPRIKDYMRNWIRTGGRVAVVSRNFSWVDGDLRELLCSKARDGDLTICVPAAIPLTTDLQKLGAHVHIFGGKETRTRFTIIHQGSNRARVAVGAAEGDTHVITEHGQGDPVLSMAEDLPTVLSRR